jgi:hypothetical protein
VTNSLTATVYRHNIVKISPVLRQALPAPDSYIGHCYPMNSSKPHQEISLTHRICCAVSGKSYVVSQGKIDNGENHVTFSVDWGEMGSIMCDI